MAAVNRAVGIVQGVKAVTTAGTAEVMVASATFTKSVIIQGKKVGGDNTGNVFVGDSNLDASVAEGVELTPGQSLSFDAPDERTVLDLNQFYIDSDTSADGVVFLYIPMPS